MITIEWNGKKMKILKDIDWFWPVIILLVIVFGGEPDLHDKFVASVLNGNECEVPLKPKMGN